MGNDPYLFALGRVPLDMSEGVVKGTPLPGGRVSTKWWPEGEDRNSGNRTVNQSPRLGRGWGAAMNYRPA